MVTVQQAFKLSWSFFGMSIRLSSMVNQSLESSINALKNHSLIIYGKLNVAIKINDK